MIKNNWWCAILVTLNVLLLIGCVNPAVSEWPEMHGKVVERGAGKPVSDAYVVVRWIGSFPVAWVDAQTSCFHVYVTRSDKNGVFTVPIWHNETESARSGQQFVRVHAYKPGYYEAEEMADARLNEVSSKTRIVEDLGRYLLAPLTPHMSDNEQMDRLLRLHGNMSCGAVDNSDVSLIEVYRLMEKQAGALHFAQNYSSILDELRYRREILELGHEEATTRYMERNKER